jgi:hypothetical protein
VRRQCYIGRERLTFWILPLILLSTTLGCHDPSGLRGRRFSLDDEALRPFAAMYEIDRTQYCLTEIDPDSIVHIETWDYYDVVLHIEGYRTYRTVSFVQEQGEYVWIGEQESHRSGRTYMTPDGELSEQIVISYFEREVDLVPVGLTITYAGAHEDISANPTCEEALQVIRDWHARETTPDDS